MLYFIGWCNTRAARLKRKGSWSREEGEWIKGDHWGQLNRKMQLISWSLWMLPEKLREGSKDKKFIVLVFLISCFMMFNVCRGGALISSQFQDTFCRPYLAVTEKARSLFPQHDASSESENSECSQSLHRPSNINGNCAQCWPSFLRRLR